MKKLFALLAATFLTVSAYAIPACVTNVILGSLQPGGFEVVGAAEFTTHYNGIIEGAALLATDCDLGPVITLSIDYSDTESRAAILSWECVPTCGDGGAVVIRAPARAASISFRIFITGQCKLGYCIVDTQYYPDGEHPVRRFPYVRD